MLYISDYADDLAHLFPGIVRGKSRLNPFTNDVLTREEFTGEALVHDHDRRRINPLGLTKDATLPERDAHCFEIIICDDPNGRAGALAFRERMFFTIEVSHQIVSAQWQRNNCTDRLDTRKSAQALEKLIVERDDIFVFRISCAG